jgi:hypothetical protein
MRWLLYLRCLPYEKLPGCHSSAQMQQIDKLCAMHACTTAKPTSKQDELDSETPVKQLPKFTV